MKAAPRQIEIQGQAFAWTPEEGLDPAAISTLDRWVWKMAQRLKGAATLAGLELEDLVQEGRLGALRAARDYDPERGASFITWATFAIRHDMIEAIERARRSPLTLSLDAPLNDDGFCLGDILPSEPVDTESDLVLDRARPLLVHLPDRDREVFLRREQGHTLAAIGQDLGMSREGVRQLIARAQKRFRRVLEADIHHRKGVPMPYPQQGKQITISDVIRRKEREERADRRTLLRLRLEAKKATKGTPLFTNEESA